jgi:hypothetical protein
MCILCGFLENEGLRLGNSQALRTCGRICGVVSVVPIRIGSCTRLKIYELTAARAGNCKRSLEARVGIEPTYKGFADLSLTTWVPRPVTFKVERPAGFV